MGAVSKKSGVPYITRSFFTSEEIAKVAQRQALSSTKLFFTCEEGCCSARVDSFSSLVKNMFIRLGTRGRLSDTTAIVAGLRTA